MLRLKNTLPIILLFLFVIPLNALAATLTVPSPYSTIQDAINAAVDGDIVLVSDGTYLKSIDFIGRAITVQSENGAGSTTIDGGGNGNGS